MKTMTKMLALLVLLVAIAGSAFADNVTADGMLITVNTVGNTSTMTINTQTCSLAGCNFLGDVSLKTFSGYTSIASWSVSDKNGLISSNTTAGAFSIVPGQQANGGCSQPGSGWVCFNLASGLPMGNGVYTFVVAFNGATSPLTPSDSLQVQLFSTSTIDVNGSGGRVDFISTTTSQVPEPASLILFGSGLLGLAGFVRRKF